MKQLTMLTMLALLGWATALHAQQTPYGFNFSQQSYAFLNSGTPINLNQFWDSEVPVPLGFTFYLDGTPLNSLTVLPSTGSLIDAIFADSIDAIFGYGTDYMEAKANTVVLYKTEGVSPARVFKIEWRQAGFYNVAGETSFQIWLYETSNAIQVRIGPQNISVPQEVFWNKKSPLIGFMLNYYYDSNGLGHFPHAQFIAGSPANPQDSVIIGDTFDDTVFEAPQYGCDGVPLPNSVFTWTPGSSVSTHLPASPHAISIIPNPASDHVLIPAIGHKSYVQIIDMQGRIVQEQNVAAGEREIELQAMLAPGVYWLRRQESDGVTTTGRFIKI